MIQRDFSQAVTFWGLALVFDPFNINTPFQNAILSASLVICSRSNYHCIICIDADEVISDEIKKAIRKWIALKFFYR